MEPPPEDQALYPPQPAVATGLKGRCPRCGDGRLFAGYLNVAPRCSACGLDYSFIDSGDGPAVFVVLIVGAIVAGGALFLEFNVQPPLWVHALIWVPLTVALSLALLRAMKGVLIALQYQHQAREGRVDQP